MTTEQDKFLNELLNTKFIDLSSLNEEILSKYTFDQVLKDTEKLLSETSDLIDKEY